MEQYRHQLNGRGMLNSQQLERCPAERQVQVAGLLVVHQAPPTAKGFRFLTLEDEWGLINVIVRPKVYSRYRQIVQAEPLLFVHGKLQREGEVVNVIANSIAPLIASR